jgi:hypothetical protein
VQKNSEIRAQIFAVLWAIAHLFQLYWDNPNFSKLNLIGFLQFLILLLASLVVLRPSSYLTLLGLSLSQVVSAFIRMPIIPNHLMITLIGNLTILAGAVIVFLKTEPPQEARISTAKVLELVTPSIRLEIVIFYFFTFFHKLNSDYLDIDSSCAAKFYEHTLPILPFLPSGDWAKYLVTYGTLLLEALLPLILLCRKTRVFAVLVAVVFHFFLAFDVQKMFLNFSSTMFAFLFLFLPVSFSKLASELVLSKFSSRNCLRIRVAFVSFYFLAIVSVLFGTQSAAYIWFVSRQLLWFLYSAPLVLILMLVCRLRRIEAQEQPSVGIRNFPAAFLNVFVIAVILNGISPYLGLKTRSAWQMYSNLNIAADDSNHLLIKQSLDLGGYLADNVQIHSSENEELIKSYIRQDLRITRFELTRYLLAHPNESVELEDQNGKYLVRAEMLPKESIISDLKRKFFWFGPIGPNNAMNCIW